MSPHASHALAASFPLQDMDVDAEILDLLDASAAAERRAKAPPPPKVRAAPRRGSVSSESIDPKKQVDLSTIPQYAKTEEQDARIQACIAGHLLFKELDEATRKAVVLSMTERTLAAGEVVITQGEDGDFFYIVDSGVLECFVRSGDADPPGRKVVEYVSGTSFGELALMYNTPRAATIIASTDACLFAIEREVFRSLILSTYMNKRNRFEAILETVPLLQSMSSTERAVLADGFDESHFPAGTNIIKEGEEGSTFYILLEGECSATQEGADHEQHEVRHYFGDRGDYFGELALLHDDGRRAATVRATTDCKCILLDKFSFERLLGPVHSILARDADNYAKHV